MIFVYFWLVCGLLGAGLTSVLDWRHGHDIDVYTLLIYAVCTLLGPFVLFLILRDWLIGINWNITLIKGRKK